MRGRLGTLLLLAAAAAVVALGALSFTARVRSFKPLGFEAVPRGESWQVVAVHDPETAVAPGDVLLLVNGERAETLEELEGRLGRRSRSQLLVERGDRLEEVEYRRPPLDIDAPYLVLALIGVIYLLIGLYTLMRGLNRQVVLFNLWCLFSAAVYLFTTSPPYSEIERWLYLLEEMARLVLPPLTLHFFLTFPRPLSSGRWLARVLPFLYLPSTFLLVLQFDLIWNQGALLAGPPERAIPLLDRLWLVLLGLYAAVSLCVLVLQLARTRIDEEGRQLLWVTLGMAGGYLPFLALYLLPRAAGFEAPELLQVAAVIPLALVPLSFAYAILRYRLWDIAIIVRDVTTYTLTLLLGIFGFSLLNLAIDRGIPEDFALTRHLLTFLAGLMVAGLLIPTRQGISSTLQRFHYRGAFGRRRALSQFGRDLLHERDLESLSSSLLRELEDGLDLEQANLYLVEGERLAPVLPEARAAELLVRGLGTRIWDQEFENITGITLPDAELQSAQHLFQLGYRYAFPLTVRGRRIGVVVTGYKVEQVPLSSDDLLLIRQLLNQASLAIENAQLLEQLQRQLTEVLELKQFNEEIIESSPAGIAVLDQAERVVSANLAFAALVGLERSAVKRRALRELLPVESLPRPEQGLIDLSFEDRLGRTRHLQLSVASFLGQSSAGYQVLVAHDVTERVSMEQRLKEQERLAALGAMAAGVAHEVNTPLTGISSYAQMLLQSFPETDPRYELLRKVERQTFRAARIVNTLLEFSRQREVAPQPVDLRSTIVECCELLEDRLRAAGIEVRLPSAGDDVPPACGNEGELHQVLTNIIQNAIDAMAERGGGTLSLSVRQDDGFVCAEVADDGPGIPPEHLPRIFQPFFSTKTRQGGTGLGLSISHEIVRRSGGELTARNRSEGGCAFTLRLPRHVGSSGPAPTASARSEVER